MTNDLTSRLTESLTLRERLQMKKNAPCLLLDISGSMGEDVEPGRTKYEAACDLVKNIPHAVTIFAFSHNVTECTKNTIPRVQGNTSLSPALKLMHSRGLKEAIVLTDGEINEYDQEESLRQVKGITLKVYYIGAGVKPPFLEKLANASGGFCSKEDLSETKQLTDKVVKLLGAGSPTQKGPIIL